MAIVSFNAAVKETVAIGLSKIACPLSGSLAGPAG